MRRAAIASLFVFAAVAGGWTTSTNSRAALACGAPLVNDGSLTVGTDNPAYPPWYAGGTKKGSPWKINDPNNGKGFEPAVAYAVAKQLGFKRSQVRWIYVPFARSYAPGKKAFDFDINQISFTPERAKVVDFSSSYYDVNQSIVVRKATAIAKARSIAALKPYKLGAQLGTTSYQLIAKTIKPKSVAVYDTNDKAVFALKTKQIDGLVVDLPTAFYVTAVQVPNSTILGQFPSGKTKEHFGMVFQKGNPLRNCVNKALATLRRNGTLKKIQQTWLSKVVGVPVLR